MFAGKPGEGLDQIVSGQQGNAHDPHGLGASGQLLVAGQASPIKQGNIGVAGPLPPQGLPLFAKDLAGEPSILDRIVDAVPDDLIVFYQPVVGVGGIGQGREEEGVDSRFGKKRQRGYDLL